MFPTSIIALPRPTAAQSVVVTRAAIIRSARSAIRSAIQYLQNIFPNKQLHLWWDLWPPASAANVTTCSPPTAPVSGTNRTVWKHGVHPCGRRLQMEDRCPIFGFG